MFRSPSIVSVICLAMAVTGDRSQAAEWVSFTGDYANPLSWSTASVPGPTDDIEFLGQGLNVVLYSNSQTTGDVLIDFPTGVITFSPAAPGQSTKTHTAQGSFVVSSGAQAVFGSAFDQLNLNVASASVSGGSALTMSNAGAMIVNNGLNVGTAGSGTTSELTIVDPNSVLTVSGDTFLGQLGAAGRLNIDAGGRANLQDVRLAVSSFSGTSGEVLITNGGRLNASNIFMGSAAVSNANASVVVRGAGSRLVQQAGRTLQVGRAGSGSTFAFTVDQGATASVGNPDLGPGGSMNIGSGSQVTAETVFFEGGELNLAANGFLFADAINLSGSGPQSVGVTNSVLSINSVADTGAFQLATDGFFTLGEPAGAASASLTVGLGDRLDVGQALAFGVSKQTEVQINGGVVTSGEGRISQTASAAGSYVIVAGLGQWVASGDLYVGGSVFGPGGSGSLILDNAAPDAVQIAGELTIFAQGAVTMAGGGVTAGAFDNTAGGTLSFIGPNPDPVIVDGGVAQLGGVLDLMNSNYAAVLGASYPLIQTDPGQVSGVFATEQLPTASGLIKPDVQYRNDGVFLVFTPLLTGDFNADGQVDAADYTVWRDSLNSTTNLAADANGDGQVTTADYAVWQQSFGDALTFAVPEPHALLLVLGAIARRAPLRGPARHGRA